MDKVEILILRNLLYNEEYLRKVIPFIKADYYEDSNQRIVFEEIEKFHNSEVSRIREAATIGFLEAIQNIAGNTNLDPEIFTEYLKPETLKWWRKLNSFWNGKSDTLLEKWILSDVKQNVVKSTTIFR